LSLILVVILALFGFLAPLPYTVIMPGDTANTLGSDHGVPVIEIQGAPTHPTDGELLLTTIRATDPNAKLHLADLFKAWFNDDQAVVPKKSVYPEGKSTQQIVAQNTHEMVESQDHATVAALNYLKLDPNQVKVKLNLADVGGPSAGLMFSLGIVDELGPESLTGGKTIAGTGTIDDSGKVGEIGGVEMKTKAAKRDGATVFLLPKAECKKAKDAAPGGLRLVPVESLSQAVDALKALETGGKVPSC
jgi:PDZ domain-containing protein